MVAHTIRMTIDGKRYVAVPESEYKRIVKKEDRPPKLPRADRHGNREALGTMAALIAQDVREARAAAGMTQAQLAESAGVRVETISRIESGKHAPSIRTMKKIDTALGDQ